MNTNFNPYNVIFNTTDACSLRCKYCFTQQNPKKATLQIAKDAIKYAVDNWLKAKSNLPQPSPTCIGCNGCNTANDWIREEEAGPGPAFSFFGGEPTLMWDEIMIPAVTWARANLDPLLNGKKIQFAMTTNGQHLTRERLELWKALDGGILLSADGCPKAQDINRPRADGKKSSEFLERLFPDLLELFPQTTFRGCTTPESVPYLLESYVYAKEHGFQQYYIMPNMREPWPEEALETLREQFTAIMKTMYLDITFGHEMLVFANFFNYIGDFLYSGEESKAKVDRCGLGTVSCGISVEGKIFGCQEHNTYNAFEDDIFYLGDIYNGIIPEQQQKLLAEYEKYDRPRNINDSAKCDTCKVKNTCAKLFCPSACYAATNTLGLLNDIECFWKILQMECAEQFLDMAKEHDNMTVIRWLQRNNYLPKEVRQNG